MVYQRPLSARRFSSVLPARAGRTGRCRSRGGSRSHGLSSPEVQVGLPRGSLHLASNRRLDQARAGARTFYRPFGRWFDGDLLLVPLYRPTFISTVRLDSGKKAQAAGTGNKAPCPMVNRPGVYATARPRRIGLARSGVVSEASRGSGARLRSHRDAAEGLSTLEPSLRAGLENASGAGAVPVRSLHGGRFRGCCDRDRSRSGPQKAEPLSAGCIWPRSTSTRLLRRTSA